MTVRLKLFAVAKQFVGSDSIEFELDEGATIMDLRDALLRRVPELVPMQDSLRFAVNSEYAEDDTRIEAADELACIPPVSGG